MSRQLVVTVFCGKGAGKNTDLDAIQAWVAGQWWSWYNATRATW